MDARKYAEWLVANEDKKGTEEFNTVATAYKVARAGGIDQYAEQKVGPRKEQPNPMTFDSEGNVRGSGEKFLIGAGKAFSDIGRGVGQMVGTVSDEEVNQAAERDKPITESGLGRAGNVVGTAVAAAPTALIPGANTYTGSALIGAGIGATQPVTEGQSRAGNAGVGALAGAGGRAVTGGVSRMLNPQTSQASRELLDEGVPLTPGQVAGGSVKRVEEGMKSIPVVGDMVRNAEVRSMEGFNKSVINKALAPIRKETGKIGNEGIEEAGSLISQAYDDLLEQMPVKIDGDAVAAINTVTSMVEGGLAPAQQRRYSQIVQDLVIDKMTPQGNMSGISFKGIVSALGQKAAQYRRSTDAEQQQLGNALTEAQRIMKDLAARQNPAKAAELKRIDSAYSQLLRVEDAAARATNSGGVFTPAQLAAASKKMDQTLRKRATSRGKATLQDTAQSGQEVLGSRLPDSGTPFRLANMALLGTPFLDPATLALLGTGAGVGAGAYSKTGVNALAKLLAERPELARQLGRGVQGLTPGSGLAGSLTVD